MNEKKCLACWEEIDDDQKICHHCGSDQEDVKDFLALAVLKQQKQKITVPKKTPVLEYIFSVDPDAKKEVEISATPDIPTGTPPSSSATSAPSSSYQAQKPSWLGIPTAQKTEIKQDLETESKTKGTSPSSKNVVCPNCLKEVPFRKFCKFCGQHLQRECENCKKIVTLTAKFCTSCGYILKSSNDIKQEKDRAKESEGKTQKDS